MQKAITIGLTFAFIIGLSVALYFLRGDNGDGPAPVTVPDQVLDEGPAEIDVIENGTIRPTFDVVRLTRDGRGVVAGKSAPNAEVYIYSNQRPIGIATANRVGDWMLLIEENPLQPGVHEFSLLAKLNDEAEPIMSADVLVINIPAQGETSPDIEEEAEILAILTPRSGRGPSRVLQRPGMDEERRRGREILLESIDFSADGKMILSGAVAPAGRANLYIDNIYQGTVTADELGVWRLGPIDAIAPGSHVFRIDELDLTNAVTLRVEYNFTADHEAGLDIGQGAVVVQRGNNLWQIASRLYGTGFRFTLIFEANEEQIRDPDLIYPDQYFLLPDDDG